MSKSDGRDGNDGRKVDAGLKDNAKKEHKPKDMGRDDHAPVGSVGMSPTPGGSGVVFSDAEKSAATRDAQSGAGKRGADGSKDFAAEMKANRLEPTEKGKGRVSHEFDRAARGDGHER
jgi:hypothetical protein